MHFSAMYRLCWYRRAFTRRYGASNKYGVGKSYRLFESISLARWRWRLMHHF